MAVTSSDSSSVSSTQPQPQHKIQDVDNLLGRINTTKNVINNTDANTITEEKVNEWITQVGVLQETLKTIKGTYKNTVNTLAGYSGIEQGFDTLISGFKKTCQNSSAKRRAQQLKGQLQTKTTQLQAFKSTLTDSKGAFIQRITETNAALEVAGVFINKQKCWENIQHFVKLVNTITVKRKEYNLEGLGNLFQDSDLLPLVITLTGTDLKNSDLTINIVPFIDENSFTFYKLNENYSIEEVEAGQAETLEA